MSTHLSLLASIALVGGSAIAQTGNPTPNAISLWRSDSLKLIAIGLPAATGPVGQAVWHTLPPDVLVYFKPNVGARQLAFRGFDWLGAAYSVGVPTFTPTLQLYRALPAPAPDQGRLLPEIALNPAAMPLAQFNPVNLGVMPAGTMFHARFELGTSVPVTLSGAGDGIAFYVKDYLLSPGSKATYQVYTNNVETGPPQSLSGITTPSGASMWLDPLLICCPSVQVTHHEMVVTYLFENSTIRPVKNSIQSSAGGWIVGAPAGVTAGSLGVSAVYGDDGRGSLTIETGAVVGYWGDSNFASTGTTGNVWFVPFVGFGGDLGGGPGLDPTPENWIANGGLADFVYVHPMRLSKWLDDVSSLLGSSGLIASLTTVDPTVAVWFGLDLPHFNNAGLLFNSLAFAGRSGGWSGPETLAFDSNGTPGGKLLRNGIDFNGIAESATVAAQQHGFAVLAPVAGTPFVGFFKNPGGFASGKSVWVQCWMLDTASTATPSSFNVVEVSNAFRVKLR